VGGGGVGGGLRASRGGEGARRRPGRGREAELNSPRIQGEVVAVRSSGMELRRGNPFVAGPKI